MPSRGLRLYAGPSCPACRRPFDLARLTSGVQHCPACGLRFEAVRFRPAERRADVREVGAAGPKEGAACAAHRRNAAVAWCERCGIFMCALCRTEADGRTLCAACFDRLAAEGTLQSTQTRHRDYVGLAWIASAVGFMVCFAGLVTGPLGVYYGFRALRQMNEWGDVGGRMRAVGAMVAGVIATVLSGATLAAILIPSLQRAAR